jgi:hypothetical protein
MDGMNMIWFALAVFIISLMIAKSSKPTWYRAIATTIASVIGGVGLCALIGFAFFYFVFSSDCDRKIGEFYESKGSLCYGKDSFNTLSKKEDGKSILITKFKILAKDKALVYLVDEEPQVITAENKGYSVIPYRSYDAPLEVSEKTQEEEQQPDYKAYNVNCNNSNIDGFYFPRANFSINYDVKNLICYQGRDVTSLFAGDGMMVTTAMVFNAKKVSAIITTAEINPKTYEEKSAIKIIYINKDGMFGESSIIYQKYTDDPETTLSNMKIVGYNNEKGIVYFSVPAWAVSHAIHAFTIPFDDYYKKVKEKFITAGDLTFVKMFNSSGDLSHDKYIGSLIVEQSEIRKGEGRVYNEYLISPEGKRICELDTDVENWRIYLPCKK